LASRFGGVFTFLCSGIFLNEVRNILFEQFAEMMEELRAKIQERLENYSQFKKAMKVCREVGMVSFLLD